MRLVRRTIRENKLVGELVHPEGEGPFAAVLCVGGSSGGIGNNVANKLAEDGFAAFSLGYFGAPGLPDIFANLPLDYFVAGVDWLVSQPVVLGNKVGITGTSRGSEAALQTATLSSKIGAVVAYVPSGIRWDGAGGKAPWTLKGQTLPYAHWVEGKPRVEADGSVSKVDVFNKVLDDKAAVADAEIEVENATCPILLIAGKDDQLWPSGRMADGIMRRLNRNDYPYEHRVVLYENAGHRIKVPGLERSSYVPVSKDTVTGELLNLGGTFEGNKAASEKAWLETTAFFCKALN